MHVCVCRVWMCVCVGMCVGRWADLCVCMHSMPPPSPSPIPYIIMQLEIEDFIPTLLYFGYTGIMVFGFWLLTGSIGFYATYFFNRKIYAAVKQD